MSDRAPHWATIDAFLAAADADADADAAPSDADATPTPAAAAPTTPTTPTTPAPTPDPTPAPTPRSTPFAGGPFREDRAKLGIWGGKLGRSIGGAPRPGGIGPLVAALLFALIIVIPVAAGKTRLQHLIDVVTGEEGMPPGRVGMGAGAKAWSAAFPNGDPNAGNAPTTGGGIDLTAPATPAPWAATLPYGPNTGRGLQAAGGGKSWRV